MSCDISLDNSVINEPASVPSYLMYGETYKADYHLEIETFTPVLNTEAELNITYNCGRYYGEFFEKGFGCSMVCLDLTVLKLLKMIKHLCEKYKKNQLFLVGKNTNKRRR